MQTDVLIIGTGQAGVPLATRLAAAGKRVVIVERGELGGTCINSGCTPTKTMIASARAAHVARTAARLGVHPGAVEIDFPAIVARKDAIVHRWREGISKRIQAAGERLHFIKGQARFVGERFVDIAGTRCQADTVVLNVGARPAVPPIAGLEAVPSLDYRSALDLRSLPDHLLIVGGGYVGCEFGQMFRRFGARVTLINRGPHLLDDSDEEISTAVEQVFRSEGVEIICGAEVQRAAPRDGGIVVQLKSGAEVAGSHLLVATGRRPNTDELGCEAGGIELDSHGHVVVDERYRSSAKGVYAVGDAIDEPQFTHVSWDDHRLLFDILQGRSDRRRTDRTIPHTVFTDPQVAGVGLTERQVRERHIEHEVATMPFGDISRAIETDETAGVCKVIIHPRSEQILGAAIVGSEAGELIHVFAVAMHAKTPACRLVEAEYVHPTFSEGVQSVLMRLRRYSLT
jgi:pyruvate/2-oxoglutarate dehydrogenase complex dihydrolipoamide dehydrogenase (E3) component